MHSISGTHKRFHAHEKVMKAENLADGDAVELKGR